MTTAQKPITAEDLICENPVWDDTTRRYFDAKSGRSGTGVMHELNESGDSRVMWDADDPDEVAAARAQFQALTGKGKAAFRVTAKGEKGEQVKTFDPKAEALVYAAPLVGG